MAEVGPYEAEFLEYCEARKWMRSVVDNNFFSNQPSRKVTDVTKEELLPRGVTGLANLVHRAAMLINNFLVKGGS